jgi:hypothetical protein
LFGGFQKQRKTKKCQVNKTNAAELTRTNKAASRSVGLTGRIAKPVPNRSNRKRQTELTM